MSLFLTVLAIVVIFINAAVLAAVVMGAWDDSRKDESKLQEEAEELAHHLMVRRLERGLK